MKIVAISDQHGYLPKIPLCDLLLICGDFVPATNHALAYQAQWLDTEFRRWLSGVPARKIVGIAGNHDLIFEHAPATVPQDLPWTYLQDSGIEFEGWSIFGTPHQPRFFDWAFNLDEPQLTEKWAAIPGDTDILVCHGPPRGYGDIAPRFDDRGRFTGYENVGSPSLLERIKQVCPRLTVFGHLHSGRGAWKIDDMTLANVTLVDESYRMVHLPAEFELHES